MANLTDSTNLTGTITLSKATGTKVTLDTDHKYLSKDIELTINAPTTTATASGATVSYGEGWIAAGSTTVTDANLVAGNIKKNVSIFGVTGTLENSLTIADVANTTGVTAQITTDNVNISLPQHSIYLEFTDSTNTTIPLYYSDTLTSTALTAYAPLTYNNKTVSLAKLDNIIYYTRPVEVWTTVFESNQIHVNSGDPYGGLYINDLGSTAITEGSIWRITVDGTSYITIATTNSPYNSPYNTIIGNPLYAGGTDDGTSIPVAFAQNPWNAWTGWSAASVTQEIDHAVKFETADTLEVPANTQLVDYTKVSAGYIDSHGDFIENNNGLKTSDYILIKQSMRLSFVGNPYYYIGLYDINKNVLDAFTGLEEGTARQDNNFAEGILDSSNLPQNVAYIRITGGNALNNTELSLMRIG